MILYHGSYLEICKPDLVHSRRNVDFGQRILLQVMFWQIKNVLLVGNQ